MHCVNRREMPVCVSSCFVIYFIGRALWCRAKATLGPPSPCQPQPALSSSTISPRWKRRWRMEMLPASCTLSHIAIMSTKMTQYCSMEPAMTNVGIVLPEDGYLQAVGALARKYGVVWIIDETHTISAGPGGWYSHPSLRGLPLAVVFCKLAICSSVYFVDDNV